MGKGSARRKEDIAKIWDNWDAIFKKEPKEKPQDPRETKGEKKPSDKNAK